jgi:guanylate kinase
MTQGPLFIISGPSGSGKSTVIDRLLRDPGLRPRVRLSVSATTRPPRPGEVDGVHYHFWDVPRFEAAIAAGEFLEWARVHGANYYGTLNSEVEPHRRAGKGVVLDVDVQGAAQVRRRCPDHLSVFLTVPEHRYEERLRQRGADDEASIRRRMATAREELRHADEYMVQLVNDDLDETVAWLRHLVGEEFARREADA